MDPFAATDIDTINYIQTAITELRVPLDAKWIYYKLLDALTHNKNDIAKFIIEKGCTIFIPNELSNTPLHIAVKNENTEMVQILLEKGAPTEAINSFGNTPLHYAAKTKNSDIIQMILEKLINDRGENLTENSKLSPLLIACWRNDACNVNNLLRSGVNPNDLVTTTSPLFRNSKVTDDLMDEHSIDWSGYTYLHVAVEHERTEIVGLLLKNGADVNIQNSRGSTPLHMAVQKRNFKIVSLILDGVTAETQSNATERLVDVNIKDYSGNTPLLLAVERNSRGIIELLLQNGADVNVQTADGVSPLSLAAKSEDEDIVGLIISSLCGKCCKLPKKVSKSAIIPEQNNSNSVRALLNSTNESGNTLLHIAVDRGSMYMIKLLLNHGADKNKRNSDGLTPIHLATERRNSDIAEFFLSYSYKDCSNACDNIHVAEEDEEFETMYCDDDISKFEELNSRLHRACMYDVPVVVEGLLLKGADIKSTIDLDSQEIPGYTCLHLAAASSSARVVELLINYGASVNAKDFNGLRPLHVAVRRRCMDIIKLLLNKGADADASDVNGNNPLHDMIIHSQYQYDWWLFQLDPDAEDDNLELRRYFEEYEYRLEYREKKTNPIEIMSLLLESGCDVNSLNKSGVTALLLASSLCYNAAVQNLLDHGADINISVNSGIAPLLHWCGRSTVTEWRPTVCKLYRTFRDHVIKLNVIGAEVNNSHLEWLTRETQFLLDDTVFMSRCQKEFVMMRGIEINSSLNVRGLLLKSSEAMGKYAYDKSVRRIVQSGDLDKMCPIYSKMVKSRVRVGVARWKYLRPASEILKTLTRLPDLCCLEIAHHLPNEYLKQLIWMSHKDFLNEKKFNQNDSSD